MTLENILTCLLEASRAIPDTLYLLVVTFIADLVIGVLVAIGRTYRLPIISPVLDALTTVFKGVPILLIIILVNILCISSFDAFAVFFHLTVKVADISMTAVAIVSLVLGSFAHMSENIRGALLSVDRGQWEAGYSVGLSSFQTFRYLVFPQMSLVAIPPVINSTNSLLKATALASTVGVPEVLNASLRTASRSYCYLEAYIAAALVFWGISIVLSLLGKKLELFLGAYRGNLPA